MADDDLETGRPRDPVRRGLGNAPLGPSQAITLFMSLMLVGLLVCTPMQGHDEVRMLTLPQPIETAERVFERNLWLQDAIEATPSTRRELVHLMIGRSDPAHESAIAAFGDILRKNGYPRPDLSGETVAPDQDALDGLRARQVVLLLEAGRVEEAQADLQRLTNSGRGSFVAALQRAFEIGPSNDARPYDQYDTTLAGDDWIGTSLELRLARAMNDAARSNEIEHRVAVRLAALSQRLVLIASIQAAILLLGLVALGVWLARNRPQLTAGTAEVPPAWTFESGYATAVRAAFATIVIWFVVSQIDAFLGGDRAKLAGEVFAGAVLIWLVRRRLLRPLGTTVGSAFGLGSIARPLVFVPIAFAIFTVQWLGSELIAVALDAGGVRSHWAESLQATASLGTGIELPIEVIVRCVLAPFFTEIGVRGLLFLTLRRNYGPWQAALFSSLLYAAVQFHSLPGLFTMTWEGFVLALAFEMSKSLVPSIAGQVLGSLLAMTALWAFWR